MLGSGLLVPGVSVGQENELIENDLIEEIRFVGNDMTKDAILRQEMVVHPGDFATPEQIEASRQGIMDLGLFTTVTTQLLPGIAGKILEVTVREKHYFFPVPKLNRDADGQISYGAQMRFDNLGGLNQRVRLTYETIEPCCNRTGNEQEMALDYSYPRVIGSQFGLSIVAVNIERSENVEENGLIVGVYDRIHEQLGLGISHWLTQEGPSTGWSASAGLFYQDRQYIHRTGTPGLLTDTTYIGLNLGVEYHRVHDYLYSREGTQYGYTLDQALVGMGADQDYSINQFYYKRFMPVGSVKHRVINFQWRMGAAGGGSKAEDPFSLGGSRNLRGYDKNTLSGRSFFSANTEFLTPIGHPAFRGGGFFDIGNTYPDSRTIDLNSVEYSAGLAFRYKIKVFVNLQLRLDIGYALGDTGKKVYFGTKNSF